MTFFNNFKNFRKISTTLVGIVIISSMLYLPQMVAPSYAVPTPPTPPFTQCPTIGVDTSCGILIVFNADGTASVYSDPSVGPYDGQDDTLVGVQNNFAGPVPKVTISGTGIFAFDGDGLCAAKFANCNNGATGYEGPGTGFTVTDNNNGDVNFAGTGLGSGTSTYFSLEGAINAASIVVSPPNSPPDCTKAVASKTTLWPPNHKMQPINILGVTDSDSDPVTIKITSIFQDEPVKSPGSGNFSPDGSGVGTDTANVRSERDGGADGRTYTIGFSADDGNGGTCTGTVGVIVPHDQSSNHPEVNQGALYDSTSP